MNDTTKAGYLTPTGAPPPYDDALEEQIRQWISGVSGLPATAIFRRFTDEQPNAPVLDALGCGFSITDFGQTPDPVYVQHDENSDYQWHFETLVVQCCFYGPSGQFYAKQFKAGLGVAQNNAELNRTGLTLGDAGDITPTPECINEQWQRRYDLSVTLHRKVEREYGIKSILFAPTHFFGE
nr:hypothetical protein [uncultured Enterobacter sp.]